VPAVTREGVVEDDVGLEIRRTCSLRMHTSRSRCCRPNPRGSKQFTARLYADISSGREGRDTRGVMRGTCVSINSTQDLARMTFKLPVASGAANLLQVTVHDRLTGFEHTSNIYPVGAFGVSKVLFTVGCKALLGRPDDFICSTKTGAAACENLRRQGKPIQCRIAGQ
jgi:hypothetical protein